MVALDPIFSWASLIDGGQHMLAIMSRRASWISEKVLVNPR